MSHNQPPKRDWDQPHHQEPAFRLRAKREILHCIARDFTRGVATEMDLEEAAVEFTDALEKAAMHKLRAK